MEPVVGEQGTLHGVHKISVAMIGDVLAAGRESSPP